jgi:group II intron reverse transcriptase/maturase
MPDFESCFTSENLSDCVNRLLNGHFDVITERPRIQTGADRIDLGHFLRDQSKHLAAIGRKILSDRYTFSPFLEQEIPKPDSKEMRTISVASIRDSIVQRAIYDYLYPIIDSRLSASVFGYRKGLNAHDAIRAIRKHFESGKVYIFDADLQKFFDTVDHDVLLDMIAKLTLDDRATNLIRRFLKTGKIPFAQVEEYKKRQGKLIKYAPEQRHKGVPQGGVLSGLLSNLYLSGFDAAVRDRHDGYVRYADDFLVCCKDGKECAQLHDLVKVQLAHLKLDLHPTKTKECVSAISGVDFLGFRTSVRGVRVRKRNVSKFKNRIAGVLNGQEVRKSPSSTLRSLVGRLRYKIRGPSDEQLRKLAERGSRVGRCKRSWIGFFRIVDDLTQIRSLDHWIRRQVSAFIWEKHRVRVPLKQMQKAGLPSLVKCLWVARSQKPLTTPQPSIDPRDGSTCS